MTNDIKRDWRLKEGYHIGRLVVIKIPGSLVIDPKSKFELSVLLVLL